jgi:hypothetical protein
MTIIDDYLRIVALLLPMRQDHHLRLGERCPDLANLWPKPTAGGLVGAICSL